MRSRSSGTWTRPPRWRRSRADAGRIRCAPRLPKLDLVLTYGGGDPVVDAYRAIGRARLHADLQRARSRHPPPGARPNAALPPISAFLGNRLPDREARVEEFFLEPAAASAGAAVRARRRRAGATSRCRPTSATSAMSTTGEHNAFNCSAQGRAQHQPRQHGRQRLLARHPRVRGGRRRRLPDHRCLGRHRAVPRRPARRSWSPATAHDVAELLGGLTLERAREIGRRARTRVLDEHTYAHRRRRGSTPSSRAALGRAPSGGRRSESRRLRSSSSACRCPLPGATAMRPPIGRLHARAWPGAAIRCCSSNATSPGMPPIATCRGRTSASSSYYRDAGEIAARHAPRDPRGRRR